MRRGRDAIGLALAPAIFADRPEGLVGLVVGRAQGIGQPAIILGHHMGVPIVEDRGQTVDLRLLQLAAKTAAP